jgi:hypothetical protein
MNVHQRIAPQAGRQAGRQKACAWNWRIGLGHAMISQPLLLATLEPMLRLRAQPRAYEVSDWRARFELQFFAMQCELTSI